MRSRFLLLALAFLPLAALAQTAEAGGATSIPSPAFDYLLGLGPIGGLIYGAYLLGKGVSVTVEVHLRPEDRGLAERAVEALERQTDPDGSSRPLRTPRVRPQ